MKIKYSFPSSSLMYNVGYHIHIHTDTIFITSHGIVRPFGTIYNDQPLIVQILFGLNPMGSNGFKTHLYYEEKSTMYTMLRRSSPNKCVT